MGYYTIEERGNRHYKRAPILDSKKYDDIFILSKIALDEELSEKEWNINLSHFERKDYAE